VFQLDAVQNPMEFFKLKVNIVQMAIIQRNVKGILVAQSAIVSYMIMIKI